MADISNKTLAILVGIAIVVSIVGIMSLGKPSVLYITGSATSGNVSVNLTSATSVLIKYNINFGNGRVLGSNASAILESNNTAAKGGSWTWTKQYVYVENDGTVNETINVSSGTSIASWLGGTTPHMYVEGWVTEPNACTDAATMSTYKTVDAQNAQVRLCRDLLFGSANDTVNASVKLTVPSDAPSGKKNVVLTFSAVQAK